MVVITIVAMAMFTKSVIMVATVAINIQPIVN